MRKRKGGGSGIPRGSKSDESQAEIERKAESGGSMHIDEESDGEATIRAIVSVTGVKDSVGDIIEPGAYEKTLKLRDAQPVWSHSWSEPIGATLDIKEVMPGDATLKGETLADGSSWPDEAGALVVKMIANRATDVGERAYQNIKFADKYRKGGSPWSVGYRATKSTKDPKTGVRRIKEMDLFEYSPVLHGANAHAKTLSVKSLGEAISALHAGGYDTTELEAKVDDGDPGPFEGLSPAEVKAIPLAIDILAAYASELGIKTSTVQGDPDLDDPDTDGDGPLGFVTLADRLEETLEPEDFTELLEAADSFDEAVSSWDGTDEAEDAVSEAAQAFLDVLEDEEAADPDDPDTWESVREAVAGTFDDATAHLYGEDSVDDAPDSDDEDDSDGEWDDDSETDDADGHDDGAEGDVDGPDAAGEGDGAGDVGKSAQRRSEVKSPSAAKRQRAEDNNAAMAGGKYPIENAEDLKKAIKLRSHGNAPNKLINGHIVKRAKALGLEHLLPDDLKPDSAKDRGKSPGPGKGSGASGGGSSEGKSYSLPDLGWSSATDSIMAAIDFSEPSRV